MPSPSFAHAFTAATLLLGYGLAVSGVAADVSSKLPSTCATDADCVPATMNLGVDAVAAYICNPSSKTCQVAVAAGQVCLKSSDCAQYHWVQSRLALNKTLDQIGGLSEDTQNVTTYLTGLCSPNHCKLASTCSAISQSLFSTDNPFDLPIYDYDQACCGGAVEGGTCANYGSASGNKPISISNCKDTQCRTSSLDPTTLVCSTQDLHSTVWIGVVITLIGAAANNIGLNLQKLALRKRSEQEDAEKKENQIKKLRLKIGALKNFPGSWSSSIRRNWNNFMFTKSYGNVRLEREGVVVDPNSHLTDLPVVESPTTALSTMRDEDLNARLGLEPSSAETPQVLVEQTTTTVTNQENLPLTTVVDGEQTAADLEKKLNFMNLIRNPIWIIGMTVYVVANFINFAALQFAPQSLVAPLGSISLVVNIIAAPLINKEKWSWKDIVGSTFIVGGSSMTVVFAGVSSEDFNLCIILKLFQSGPTIAFLGSTVLIFLAGFVFICIVEKNIEPTPQATTGAEITITTTTTTVTIPPSPGHQQQYEDLAHPSAGNESNAYPMTYLSPTNPPSTPTMTEAMVDNVENQNSVLEWTSSLYSRVYIPAPVRKRVSKLFTKPDSPTPVFSDSPKLSATQSPLSNVVPVVPDTKTEPKSLGLNVDVKHRPSLPTPPPPAADYSNEFKISDVDSAPNRTGIRDIAGVSGLSIGTLAGSGSDDAADTLSPDDDRESTNLKAADKLSWKMKLYMTLPSGIRNMVDNLASAQLIPRFERKFKMTDKVVSIGLPISYASLGGLMGTTTTLFAKATIHLLTNSFTGSNEFNSFWAWAIVAVTVVTAFSQVYWINMGLQRYDALLQLPVFFVVWTVFDVIGGGVYFQEFAGFSTRQYGLFILAIGVIFFGVFVLGDRLKKTHV
ncbi:hypothetical protein BC830DRAFT_1124571 [Chytriomyces sp. MP71]|nr:hypothetical protein BC830DRAFT_1124571 [Chytriomyces sp. MP71]